MSPFASLPLQTKLVRLVLLAAALALLITAAAVFLYDTTTAAPRARALARSQAEQLAEQLVSALEFDDAATAGRLLDTLRHQPEVRAAQVFRSGGAVFARFQRTPADALPAFPQLGAPRPAGRFAVTVPVDGEGGPLGTLWLEADNQPLGARVFQYGVPFGVAVCSLATLALLLSLMMRRTIVEPVQELAAVARAVSDRKDYGLRATVRGDDEIGKLAASFNGMLTALSERESRLARHYAGLVALDRAEVVALGALGRRERLQLVTSVAARAQGIERVGVWLYDETRTALRCADLFELTPNRHSEGTVISLAGLPAFTAALATERVIDAADVTADPRVCEFADYAAVHRVTSMLDVPIHWRGRVAGVVCHEHVGPRRVWQADEIGFAVSVADRIALLLESDEAAAAEQRVRESEGRYRELIEGARDAIFTLSPDGRIEQLNQAVETITGWKRARWIGRRFTDAVYGEDRALAEQCFREVAAGGQPRLFELRIRSRSGPMVTLEFVVSPQHRAGRVAGVLGVGRDVTERRAAAAAQVRLETQLRQAQKMEAIGNLAGGIAHDFNNILTGIMGNAQLAEMALPPSHPAQSHVGSVLSASKRAKELVDQILTFSRRQEQRRVALDLGRSVRDSLRLLRPVLPATIEIRTHLPDGLPPVLADATQVHQVIMNLATNAAHAMEDRGGLLELSLAAQEVAAEFARQHPQIKPGRYVRLAVADTGRGIAPEAMQHLFEPFYTTKEQGKGTGLGLAVVHGIVEQHEGAVLVQSTPGHGATFQIFFPVCLVAHEAAPEAPAPVSWTSNGARLLLVDDEEIVVKVAERVLVRAGYRVTALTDPRAALAMFRGMPDEFDLVITDLTMPHLKGTALAAEIRRVRPQFPVLLSTGFGGELDAAGIAALGLHGPLPKPFTAEALLAGVAAVIARDRVWFERELNGNPRRARVGPDGTAPA